MLCSKLKADKQKILKGEWLNSPNVYARTETEETGTPNPKKITKWLKDDSPNKTKTSTPIRIENKHQFAPQGSDPKELKNHQKQVGSVFLFVQFAFISFGAAAVVAVTIFRFLLTSSNKFTTAIETNR